MNDSHSATADIVKSTAVAGETEEHELFLGQFIAKDFNSPFEGEVTVTPDHYFDLYKIAYEDGDEEELTYNEVKRYVAYNHQEIGGGVRKRKKHEYGFTEKFPVGTKILKNFLRTFGGKITRLPKSCNKKYTVTYDADGFSEEVSKREVKKLVEKYKAWIEYIKKNLKKEVKEETETTAVSESSSDVTYLEELPPLIPTTKEETVEEQEEEEVQLVSDSAPRGLSQVKLEMFGKATARRVSSTYLERQRRIEARMQALKEPGGAPRKVFRRGCQKATLTQVLGGSGTSPCPIVRVVPTDIFENGTNPFIQRGQYYFAGRSDWNPWTPAYPGDVGFVDSDMISGQRNIKNIGLVDREKQELFHCFLDCAKKSYLPHYLGPNAKGKRLYLGRYRAVPQDQDEVNIVEKNFLFRSLEWDSQLTHAEWNVLHDVNIDAGKYCRKNKYTHLHTNLAMEVYADVAKTKAENEKEGLWESLAIEKKKERAWIEMLLDNDFFLSIRPIEFVDYDENLYKKLVEIGADSGEVSLEPTELGPL